MAGVGQDGMAAGDLVDMAGKGKATVEEEEFEVDPFEGMKEQAPKWYTMALYYSGQRSKFLAQTIVPFCYVFCRNREVIPGNARPTTILRNNVGAGCVPRGARAAGVGRYGNKR